MVGAEHSVIQTVDRIDIKKIKGKLYICVDLDKRLMILMNVSVLQKCPYDIILGHYFLTQFDNINNQTSTITLIRKHVLVRRKFLLLTHVDHQILNDEDKSSENRCN